MAWEVWKLKSSSSTTPATLQEGLSVIEKVGLPRLFLSSLLHNMEQRRVSDVHPDGLIGWGLDSGDHSGRMGTHSEDHSSRMGTGQWGSQQ